MQHGKVAVERRCAASATVQRNAAATARPPGCTLQERLGNKATQLFIARRTRPPSNLLLSGHGNVTSRPLPTMMRRAAAQFKDCSGTTHADIKVENGRQRAIDFLQASIRELKKAPDDPASSSQYRRALRVHFINPSANERATIRENYQSILAALKVSQRITCASSDEDLEVCQRQTQPTGFVRSDSPTIILCPDYHDESIVCRAIILIHEAAHTIGIGASPPHPPYRGAPEYPGPAATPKERQNTATRLTNPDAYAYFAADIGRETDTHCLPPLQLNQTIEIIGTPP
jgi:Lysine-specific metallo-endopeptidase